MECLPLCPLHPFPPPHDHHPSQSSSSSTADGRSRVQRHQGRAARRLDAPRRRRKVDVLQVSKRASEATTAMRFIYIDLLYRVGQSNTAPARLQKCVIECSHSCISQEGRNLIRFPPPCMNWPLNESFANTVRFALHGRKSLLL